MLSEEAGESYPQQKSLSRPFKFSVDCADDGIYWLLRLCGDQR